MTESESVALPLGDAPQRVTLYHRGNILSILFWKNILKLLLLVFYYILCYNGYTILKKRRFFPNE